MSTLTTQQQNFYTFRLVQKAFINRTLEKQKKLRNLFLGIAIKVQVKFIEHFGVICFEETKTFPAEGTFLCNRKREVPYLIGK